MTMRLMLKIAVAALIAAPAGEAAAQPRTQAGSRPMAQVGSQVTEVGAETAVDPARPSGAEYEINQLLAWADQNGNGALDRGEFQALEDKLFAEADRNSDGKVSRAELVGYVGQNRKYTEGTVADPAARAEQSLVDRTKQVIEQADANGDGKIQKAEATAQLKGKFTELDVNGDGALDEAELKQMRRPLGAPAEAPAEVIGSGMEGETGGAATLDSPTRGQFQGGAVTQAGTAEERAARRARPERQPGTREGVQRERPAAQREAVERTGTAQQRNREREPRQPRTQQAD